MKLSIFILLLVFSGTNSFCQTLKGDSWQQVQANGGGTLSAIYYDTPGLVFKENGEMKGVCVDIMDEFIKFTKQKYNVNLDYQFLKNEQVFSKFLEDIKRAENVMGVCNTSITKERKEYLSFSPSYMTNPPVLLSNNDAPTIKSLEEMPSVFADYTAVVIKESTYEKYILEIKKQYYPDLKVEYVNSDVQVNQKLKSAGNYFTFIDFTEYFDAVKKRFKVKRHPISLKEFEDELGFIFPKGSDWTGVWNEFLTPEFKESVTYRKIVADNLGASFMNLIK